MTPAGDLFHFLEQIIGHATRHPSSIWELICETSVTSSRRGRRQCVMGNGASDLSVRGLWGGAATAAVPVPPLSRLENKFYPCLLFFIRGSVKLRMHIFVGIPGQMDTASFLPRSRT